jgi:hypothetical protein
MFDDLHLDPYEILGLGRDASSKALKEAYYRQSRRYHPDQGGEEWVFRIVAKAYQVLQARRPEVNSDPADTGETSRIRPGVHDKGVEPGRIAAVEVVWRRYQVSDSLQLLSEPAHRRNLSGSVLVAWPDPGEPGLVMDGELREMVPKVLGAAVEDLRTRTAATSARSSGEDGRFEGRIDYPDGPTAGEAFKRFHAFLKARGLGVRQWSRDVSVPRNEMGA